MRAERREWTYDGLVHSRAQSIQSGLPGPLDRWTADSGLGQCAEHTVSVVVPFTPASSNNRAYDRRVIANDRQPSATTKHIAENNFIRISYISTRSLMEWLPVNVNKYTA